MTKLFPKGQVDEVSLPHRCPDCLSLEAKIKNLKTQKVIRKPKMVDSSAQSEELPWIKMSDSLDISRRTTSSSSTNISNSALALARIITEIENDDRPIDNLRFTKITMENGAVVYKVINQVN